MKKGLNSEGFTLVELLAIMVILGVLLMVAIPQVTRTISDSRKEVFVDTAVAFLSSAKTGMVNGSYTQSIPIDPTFSVCIPFNQIEYEKGSKSPFGAAIDTKSSYVKVYNDKGTIKYYVYMRDQKDHFLGPVEESVINSSAKKTKLVFNKSHFYKTGVSPFSHGVKKGSFRDPANIIKALGRPVTKESDPAGLCTYLIDPTNTPLSDLKDGYVVYDPLTNEGAGGVLADSNADVVLLKKIYENTDDMGYPGWKVVTTSKEPVLKELENGSVVYDKDENGNIKYDEVKSTPFEAYLAHQLPAKLKEGISTEEEEEEEEEDW